MRNQKFQSKRMNYEEDSYTPSQGGRPPMDDGSSKGYDTTIDLKAFKNLPNSSYAVKVDPYTEVNNPATPYHILNRFNKVIGGRYNGQDNLDGGNVVQYNASVNSKFLKIFDSALLAIGLNYRYLPVLASDTARGAQMVDEVRKAISEIVSSLNATTFKDQNIFYYGVETSLPMGSAVATKFTVTESGSSVDHYVYMDIADVIYAMSMEYQLILQDIVMVFNMFNANRTRMGTMIRMAWDREVPILNSYFGLLKKKSFLSLFDSLALNLQGEYVDVDWMRQVNTVAMLASRRSNSMSDPLLEVVGAHNKPDLFRSYIFADRTVYPGVTNAIFDYTRDMQYTPFGGTAISFDSAVKNLAVYLSVTDTLRWARGFATLSITENDRFNAIKDLLDVVVATFSVFKYAFTDIRTVFSIMSKINVVNWTLGLKLNVTRDTDCEICNYLVVNQIYKEVFGGATNIRWNDDTKRWRTYGLWNLYYGTPEYAEKSGGSFISFSVKTLQAPVGVTPDNIGYLPVAFTLGSFVLNSNTGYCMVINRIGSVVLLTRSAGYTISSQWQLTRLAPLVSQGALGINVPTATVGTAPTDAVEKSHLYRFMLQVCDTALVDGDLGIDPDILAVYEYEIEDFTNEVISYCRSNGPFRLSQNQDTTLGFFGLAVGRK